MPDRVPTGPPDSPSPRGSYFTIGLALLACCMFAAFLMILPGFIGPVIVIGTAVFLGIFGLHYLLWGRWLGRIIEEEQAEEAADRDTP